MTNKITVAVFFGGKSAEHDVSLVSAKNIIMALDSEKYEVLPVGIDRSGIWHLVELFSIMNSSKITINPEDPVIHITPGRKEFRFLDAQENRRLVPDVAFPVLHGPFGEDGSIQGIFRHIGLPFVGADVLGSAVGMDKDIMKQILIKARIPTAKYFALRKYENPDSDLYIKELGMPIFVKPANMGSSIGVNRAETKEDLLKAIKQAFQYDSKIIIEESIDGREIECSVMGNHHAEASSPGEIVLHSKFYSYDEKYDSSSEAELIIPADLKPETARAIKETAVKTFRELQCSGFARVDFFVKDEQIYVNEINTLPGFTAISMYPKLWEYDGISTPELLDHLIQYAFEKYDNENALKKTI